MAAWLGLLDHVLQSVVREAQTLDLVPELFDHETLICDLVLVRLRSLQSRTQEPILPLTGLHPHLRGLQLVLHLLHALRLLVHALLELRLQAMHLERMVVGMLLLRRRQLRCVVAYGIMALVFAAGREGIALLLQPQRVESLDGSVHALLCPFQVKKRYFKVQYYSTVAEFRLTPH